MTNGHILMNGLAEREHIRHESTPDTRATVLTASITSPGSSSCLTLRSLSSTISSNNPGVSNGDYDEYFPREQVLSYHFHPWNP